MARLNSEENLFSLSFYELKIVRIEWFLFGDMKKAFQIIVIFLVVLVYNGDDGPIWLELNMMMIKEKLTNIRNE